MMKSYWLKGLLVFITCTPIVGKAQEKKPQSVQIQFDVLGFAQQGYGIVGGYTNGKNRFDIDLLSNTLFESFTNSSQDFENTFKERRTVSSLNYYRYLKTSGEGFYYGVGISYYEYIVENENSKETIADNAYKPGLYIGYQIHPLKKQERFLLDIWFGGRWHWEGEEKLPFANGDYFIIPTLDAPLGMIKFGWKFKTNN